VGKHDPVVKSSCWNRPFSLGINRGDKMDGIYPDKNGHWVIDKRYMKERIFERTHSANRSFADRILSRRMVEVEEGVYNIWKREFKAVAESWRDNNLPEIQGGKSTQVRYLSIVKCHLVPFFKDKCFGNIVMGARREFNGRIHGNDASTGYTVPDFIKISHAYGLKTETIDNDSGLTKKIQTILKTKGALVIDLNIDPHEEHDGISI
jgi:hypothetical protein